MWTEHKWGHGSSGDVTKWVLNKLRKRFAPGCVGDFWLEDGKGRLCFPFGKFLTTFTW
jgi:hypothetical protein